MPPQQRTGAVSMGEVLRRLEDLIEAQKQFRAEVNGRFDEIAGLYVRKDVYDADQRATGAYTDGLGERLTKIENNQAWIVRIVISTVVMALIGGLFAASKLVGG